MDYFYFVVNLCSKYLILTVYFFHMNQSKTETSNDELIMMYL